MSEIALQVKEPEAALAMSEATAVVQMVDRAARDPNVDITKMRELLAMRREIMAFEAQRNFDDAMSVAQAEMGPIIANANNTQTRSKYATYDALDRAIRPIYTRHGFSVTFGTADTPLQDHVRITAIVACNGHREHHHVDMPADGKGAKGGDVMTKTHATVSAISYGRRAILVMAFNLAVDRDDDGNAAGRISDEPKMVDEAQYREVSRLIEETQSDEDKLLAYVKCDDLHNLTQSQYRIAIAALKKKAANK